MERFITQAAVVEGNLPGGAGMLLGGAELLKFGMLEAIPALPRVTVFPRFEAFCEETPPKQLFQPAISTSSVPAPRYIRVGDPRQFLVFTDGSCPDNGQEGARAGCAFVFRPAVPKSMIPHHTISGHSTESMKLHTVGYQSWRLEEEGPDGKKHSQTSNRAELRAVIGVLQFRYWTGEGFHRMVIATDSAYVINGITDYVRAWSVNDHWKTSRGKAVLNQDLWKELIKELNKWRDLGLEVSFWKIPRELNEEADRFAKAGAEMPPDQKWSKLTGIVC